MARKRKIPVRKHHGIRDPLKQLEQREKKLKKITNSPPEKGDSNKVSFKFSQFKKIADATKAGKKFKKAQCGQEDIPKAKNTKKKDVTTPANKFKAIKQFVDEPDVAYLRRVNRVTTESLKEAQYEAKYGVNVVRDPSTGMITIKKRPKNEIDELMKKKEMERRHGGKAGNKGKTGKAEEKMDPKVAKELIKQTFREQKEEKNKASTELVEYKKDVFKFGEVVHAPPTLSTIPRKAQKSETVSRPGKKNNLLLQSLLNEPQGQPSASISSSNKTKSKTTTITKAQLKGKRKDLPVATRSMLENERNKFVELYRKLKKSKEKPVNQNI